MDNEQEINKKNTLAFRDAIKILQTQMYDQQVQITKFNTTISSLVERIASLEKQLLNQIVLTTGRGPSVK